MICVIRACVQLFVPGTAQSTDSGGWGKLGKSGLACPILLEAFGYGFVGEAKMNIRLCGGMSPIAMTMGQADSEWGGVRQSTLKST